MWANKFETRDDRERQAQRGRSKVRGNVIIPTHVIRAIFGAQLPVCSRTIPPLLSFADSQIQHAHTKGQRSSIRRLSCTRVMIEYASSASHDARLLVAHTAIPRHDADAQRARCTLRSACDDFSPPRLHARLQHPCVHTSCDITCPRRARDLYFVHSADTA